MDSSILTVLTQVAQTPSDDPPAWPMLMTFGVIFLLFWLMILRPQRNEQKKREQMIKELVKGDKVVTAGGIHGTVESIDTQKDIVALSVAPKVTMHFNRTAVASVTHKKGQPKDASAEEKKAEDQK